MKDNTRFKIMASLIILVGTFYCNKSQTNDDSTNLLLLLGVATNAPCTNCYCNYNVSGEYNNSPSYCVKYSSTWSISAARGDCQNGNSSNKGTFSETACEASNVIVSCDASKGIGLIQKPTTILFYGAPYPNNYGIAQSTSLLCTTSYLGKPTLATDKPRLRFKNQSGNTETYSIHSSAACGAGTLIQTIASNVTNGSTTNYVDLISTPNTANSSSYYAISYNGGTNCSNAVYSFSNGIIWTVTSGTSTYSVSTP